jgi:hypothetical protein
MRPNWIFPEETLRSSPRSIETIDLRSSLMHDERGESWRSFG